MRNTSMTMTAQNGRYQQNTVMFRTEREYRQYVWKMRRQKQMRNRIVLGIFTVCLILVLAFSYSAIISHAETDPDQVAFKYFKKVEVAYGDTLWSIAEEYKDEHYSGTMDYIREVKQINRLISDDLQAGDSLVVPYYSYEYVK